MTVVSIYSYCCLIRKKPNLSYSNENGLTPLITLASSGCIEQMEILLAKGVDVNKSDKNGESAIFYGLKARDLFKNELDLFLKYNLDLEKINAKKVN